MKYIKISLLFIILLLTLLIGIYIKDDKIYYLSLGDGLSLGINNNDYESIGYSDYIKEYLEKNNKLKFYTKEFSNKDARITDIINMIQDNREIEKTTIQKSLKDADIITISAGLNEILYKNNTNISYLYDYIDTYIYDMEKLLEIVKEYNNKKIFVLGYYNPTNDNKIDKYIIYANDKLIGICDKEKINYVDLYTIFKTNPHLIYNINNFYPNSDGYKLIANEIIKKL